VIQEGQLLMTQAERDRLVTSKKTSKTPMTLRKAGEDLGVSAGMCGDCCKHGRSAAIP
jgi:hypothetical protein